MCSGTSSLMYYRRALNWPYCHHMRWHSSPNAKAQHKECRIRTESIQNNKRRNPWIACSLVIISISTFSMKNVQEIVFPLVQPKSLHAVTAFALQRECSFTNQQLRAQGQSRENSSSPILSFSLLSNCICA